MIRRSVSCLVLLLLASISSSAASSFSTSPIVAVIANPSVGVKKLGHAELRAIFTVSQKRWGNGVSAVPFNYPPENSLRAYFDKAVLGLKPSQVAKFWIDQRIRGKARPPRHVLGEVLVGRVVVALPGAIGYVHKKYIPEGVLVVAFVVDGKILPPDSIKGNSE